VGIDLNCHMGEAHSIYQCGGDEGVARAVGIAEAVRAAIQPYMA